ncbi:hypothetical protein HHI36_013795 [Cryptolaemus montrouzieri]|uniref:Uncharacterized protein n=1 Tax=Cryptolaemus montrouzieri TaxID=559131 RepID=A0ABD2NIA7_9CUCU
MADTDENASDVFSISGRSKDPDFELSSTNDALYGSPRWAHLIFPLKYMTDENQEGPVKSRKVISKPASHKKYQEIEENERTTICFCESVYVPAKTLVVDK